MAGDGAQEDSDGQGHNPFMVRHARVWSGASAVQLDLQLANAVGQCSCGWPMQLRLANAVAKVQVGQCSCGWPMRLRHCVANAATALAAVRLYNA